MSKAGWRCKPRWLAVGCCLPSVAACCLLLAACSVARVPAQEIIITIPSSFGFTARLLNRTGATQVHALVNARYRAAPSQMLVACSSVCASASISASISVCHGRFHRGLLGMTDMACLAVPRAAVCVLHLSADAANARRVRGIRLRQARRVLLRSSSAPPLLSASALLLLAAVVVLSCATLFLHM